MIKRITPVLFVDHIEPCVEFWTRLGFEKTAEVPEGDRLGFVSLASGGIEIMYQTYASLEKDLPSVAEEGRTTTFLFVEIADFVEVKARLGDATFLVEDRATFYGSREMVVREPGGHLITFAHFAQQPG